MCEIDIKKFYGCEEVKNCMKFFEFIVFWALLSFFLVVV